MHRQVRAVLLAGAALAAPVPASGAAALAAHSGPAPSHAAGEQALTWTIVPSANRGGAENGLSGVSCVSASACIAVGSTSHGDTAVTDRTLIESWNGSTWSIMSSPNRSAINFLNSVSCTSATACTAVGESYSQHSAPKTLAESWNGTTWSIVPSPDPASRFGIDYLNGVSCTSASQCVAVGQYRKSSAKTSTLVESWNGTAWSVVRSPNPGGGHRVADELQDVSCVSATACTAVGGYQIRHTDKTTVESWDGSTWSVVPSPNQGSDGDYLFSVSCTAADACMAIGHYSNSDTQLLSLAESWNGSTWSIVPLPSVPGDQVSSLNGISCAAANDCAAVGGAAATPTSTSASTLVESWDGSAWSVVPSPNAAGAPNSGFGGVSCPATTTCVAVGSDGGPRQKSKTLTELGTPSG